MSSFNKVILMGNLAQDPESKEHNGTKITNFVVAVNRQWKGPEGEEMKEVSFIDCSAFGGRAKAISDHFTKGRPIFIEGRLKQEKWVDKETGKNQSRIRVIVDNFNFIDSKKSTEVVPACAGGCASTTSDSAPVDDFDVLAS